jgi:branched-chain amino acid aminotransferase
MTEPIVSAHISLNGALLPREQAHISIFNQALFYSFGVYESIEIDGGVLFHLDDHLERLFHSAQLIELPMRYSRQTLRAWVEALVEADSISEALLRIIVFGPNGDDDLLVYILPGPLPHYPSTYYTRGATAITYEGCRPLPQAKTLNTLVNYLALRRARRLGAHEAFLVDPYGCLTEGSRSNLFAVRQGTLVTPPAQQVLSGITRDLVLRMAAARGIPAVERPLPRDELERIEEMFVTSTSMHVIPIVRVDEQSINGGTIGPITRALMHDFEAYYASVMGRAVVARHEAGVHTA